MGVSENVGVDVSGIGVANPCSVVGREIGIFVSVAGLAGGGVNPDSANAVTMAPITRMNEMAAIKSA